MVPIIGAMHRNRIPDHFSKDCSKPLQQIDYPPFCPLWHNAYKLKGIKQQMKEIKTKEQPTKLKNERKKKKI